MKKKSYNNNKNINTNIHKHYGNKNCKHYTMYNKNN